ncbi:10356_t:CDS:2, partial [Dentiscutata heterogama]
MTNRVHHSYHGAKRKKTTICSTQFLDHLCVYANDGRSRIGIIFHGKDEKWIFLV